MPLRTSEWLEIRRKRSKKGSKTMGGTTAVNKLLLVSSDQVVSIAPQPARKIPTADFLDPQDIAVNSQ